MAQVSSSPTLNELVSQLHQAIADKDMPLIEALGAAIKELTDEVASKSRKVVQICNITRQTFSFTTSFGTIGINGRKGKDRYALTPIREYRDRIVYDDKHQIPIIFTAVEVAKDIVRHCNGDVGYSITNEDFADLGGDVELDFAGSDLGVFLCDGDVPTQTELRMAEDRMRAFDIKIVQKADEKWSAMQRGEKHWITTAEHRAASRLVEAGAIQPRPWVFKPESSVQCPICKQPMPKGAIVHAGVGACGQIVDREGAKAAGLLPADEPKE